MGDPRTTDDLPSEIAQLRCAVGQPKEAPQSAQAPRTVESPQTAASRVPASDADAAGRAHPAESQATAIDARLRICTENLLDCFGIFSAVRDAEGRISDFRVDYLNPHATLVPGRSATEQLGRGICELLPHIRGTDTFDRLCEVVDADRPLELHTSPDGTAPASDAAARYYDVRAFRLGDGLAAVWHDVTDRKRQADAALERRFDSDQLLTMADSIPQLAWMAHPDGQVFWYNRRWYEYTGTTPQQMMGWGWQSVHDPQTLPRVLERWKGAIASGTPTEMEFPLRRADGQFGWFLTRIVPMKDPAGRVVRWFGTNTDVTDLKRLEEQLRQRAEEVEKLMDVVPVAIWVAHDRQCTQITGNRTANVYYEAALGEIVSATAPEGAAASPRRFYSSDGRPLSPQELPMQVAAATGTDVRGAELQVALPSGRMLTMWGYATPLRDPEGRVRGCIGAFVDISERKRVEEALLESRRRFQTLAAATFEGIAITEAGRIVDANEQLAHMFGYEPSELIGMEVASLIVPEDRERVLQSIRSRSNADAEHGIVRKDGTVITVESHGRVTAYQGREVRVTAVRDITARRRNEQVLQDALAQAEEGRRMLEALMENVPEGIIVTGGPPDFPVRKVSRYGAQTTGSSPDTGTAPQQQQPLSFYLPDGRAATPEQMPLYRATRGGEVVKHAELTVQRADGRRIPIIINAAPVRDAAGNIIAGINCWRDITELKQSEQLLRRSMEAAEAANRAKDQFLAVLSHELRTPLTPVLTAAQMMEADPHMPAESRALVSMIRRNIELEARLIDDLLDLTRISRGKLELHLGTVDVHEQVQHVVAICDSDVRGNRQKVRLELGAGRHHLRADAARVQQVLWNLVKNACKFTPPGGSIAIRTANAVTGDLVVEVQDDGIGIEPDALARIFDAFEQGSRDMTRLFGGLGLGLAISKGLMELHGGNLFAASEGRQRGATFTMRFSAASLADPSELVHGGGDADAAARPSFRILLVEDHVDTARVLARLLRATGHQVRTAETVGSALRAAAGGSFDVVISDIGLPDGSGYDLMRQLVSKYRVRGIALSGYGMDDDIRRSHEAGFSDHLTKPVDMHALRAAIARLAAETPG